MRQLKCGMVKSNQTVASLRSGKSTFLGYITHVWQCEEEETNINTTKYSNMQKINIRTGQKR